MWRSREVRSTCSLWLVANRAQWRGEQISPNPRIPHHAPAKVFKTRPPHDRPPPSYWERATHSATVPEFHRHYDEKSQIHGDVEPVLIFHSNILTDASYHSSVSTTFSTVTTLRCVPPTCSTSVLAMQAYSNTLTNSRQYIFFTTLFPWIKVCEKAGGGGNHSRLCLCSCNVSSCHKMATKAWSLF